MKRRFRNLAVKLFGSRKRQVLAGLLIAVFAIAVCRLAAVLKAFSMIRMSMPDIVYLNYDTTRPNLLNFQVAYPEIKSPLKVDFVGIKGRLTLAEDARELVAFGLNDISIDKRKPLSADVGMFITNVLAQELLDIVHKRSFYMCVSFVVCARFCGIPMYFHKQLIHKRELSEDAESIDFARHADMVSISTSESSKSGVASGRDLLGVDIYVDKLKLIELVRSKVSLFRSTEINTRVDGYSFFTNLGFLKLLMTSEFDLKGDTDRFIGIHIVIDRAMPDFGPWIVAALRNGYPDLDILGYEKMGCTWYCPQEPLFSMERVHRMTEKKKKNASPPDDRSELAELKIEQRLVDNDIFLVASVNYNSALRRAFSFFKFILPRDDKLHTRIYFMLNSDFGLAGMATLTIKPFEIGNQEVFLKPAAEDVPKPDAIESAVEDSSSYSDIPVSFAEVIVPTEAREELFTVKFSKIKILELLRAYKQPTVVIDIHGERIFSVFNRLKVMINADFGLFLASENGAAYMISEGNTNKIRDVKLNDRRAEHDYTAEHVLCNVADKTRTVKCVSTMELPSGITGANDVIKFTLPNIDIECHCTRGMFTFDPGATELYYSRTEGKFIGRLHAVSTYTPSTAGIKALCNDDLLSFFSKAAVVKTNLAGNERLLVSELLSVIMSPTGRAPVEDGAVHDERLEIRKLRCKLVERKGVALKAYGIKQQTTKPSGEVNWQHVGACVSAKIRDFYSILNGRPSMESEESNGVPSCTSIPCIIPVHLSMDDSPQSLSLLRFRLQSGCDANLGQFDFKKQFEDFLNSYDAMECPFFYCIKHVIRCDSLHLIIDGITEGPFKFNEKKKKSLFAPAASPDNVSDNEERENKEAASSSEDPAKQEESADEVCNSIPDISVIVAQDRWTEMLWGDASLWRTDETGWMKTVNSKDDARSVDGELNELLFEKFNSLPEDDLDSLRMLVGHEIGGQRLTGVEAYALNEKIDRGALAADKYVHGKVIPSANDYIMETPADDGLASISIVRPVVVVTTVDDLVFPYIEHSILVQIGLNNLEYIRKIRKGLLFKIFNPNDTLSTLTALILNHFVLNLNTPGNEKKSNAKEDNSHIKTESILLLDSVRSIGKMELKVSAVLPRPMLEISEYLVFDAFNYLSGNFRILGDKSESAFDFNVTFEKLDVFDNDLESFRKDAEGLSRLAQKRVTYVKRFASFVDRQKMSAKEYLESEETAKELGKEYEKKESADSRPICSEPLIDPTAARIYSERSFYKKYRLTVGVRFDTESVPCTCHITSSFGGKDIAPVHFGTERCFLFLNILLFRDSYLESFVGNGHIRKLLDSHFKEKHSSATSEFFDRICNYVRSAPLFGLDIKDIMSLHTNNLQLGVDVYSSDFDRWVELKIAEAFANSPFVHIPARLLLKLEIDVPHLLSFVLIECPVISLGSATVTLDNCYFLDYSLPFADKCAAAERHRKMRVMRSLVQGFGTCGAVAVPVDATIADIKAVSMPPIIQDDKAGYGVVDGGSAVEQAEKLECPVVNEPALSNKAMETKPVPVEHAVKQSTEEDTDIFYSFSNICNDDESPNALENNAAGRTKDRLDSLSRQGSDDRSSVSDLNYSSCVSEIQPTPATGDDGVLDDKEEQPQEGWRSNWFYYICTYFKSLFYGDFSESSKTRNKDRASADSDGKDKPAEEEKSSITEPSAEIDVEERQAAPKTDEYTAPSVGASGTSLGTRKALGNKDDQPNSSKPKEHANATEHPADPRHPQLVAKLEGSGVVLPWDATKNIIDINDTLANFSYGGSLWSFDEFVELYQEERKMLYMTIHPLSTDVRDPPALSARPIAVTACLNADFYSFIGSYEQSRKRRILTEDAEKEPAVSNGETEKVHSKEIIDMLVGFFPKMKPTDENNNTADPSQAPKEQVPARKMSTRDDADLESGEIDLEEVHDDVLKECNDVIETAMKDDGYSANIAKALYSVMPNPLYCIKPSHISKDRTCTDSLLRKMWRIIRKNPLNILRHILYPDENTPFGACLYDAALLRKCLNRFKANPLKVYSSTNPRVEYFSDTWLRYVYSSQKVRHALLIPLVMRHVSDHMLYLDLHVPLRLYFINSRSLSLSFSLSNRVIVIAKLKFSSNAKLPSKHGFSMSIPLLIEPEKGTGEVTSVSIKEIASLQVYKPSPNDYIITLLCHLDRSDDIGLCFKGLTLGARLAANFLRALQDLKALEILINDYKKLDMHKYYSLQPTAGWLEYFNALVYLDRDALQEYRITLSEEEVSLLHKAYKDSFNANLAFENVNIFTFASRVIYSLVKYNFINGITYVRDKVLHPIARAVSDFATSTASAFYAGCTKACSKAKEAGTSMASTAEGWLSRACKAVSRPFNWEFLSNLLGKIADWF